jgi:small subunit ribosomal protein S8
MYNDTVSDFVTRLRNAAMADKKIVRARYSKMVEEIAKLLKSEGIIASIERDGYFLDVTLSETTPLAHIKRLSRPSLRRYVGYNEIPRPRSGYSTIIISTPKGILTGSQARKQKVGGELVCEVW